MSDDQPELPVVTATVTPEPLPAGMDIPSVAALVRDLAINLYALPDILAKHKLTQGQYDTLSKNEFFKRAVETFAVEWHSPMSTNKRLALLAAAGLEDAMPKLTAKMQKDGEQLANIVEVAKLFAKMSGVGEEKQSNVPSEKFNIIINLGEDVVRFEKSRPVIEVSPVQSEPEGESESTAVAPYTGIPGSNI